MKAIRLANCCRHRSTHLSAPSLEQMSPQRSFVPPVAAEPGATRHHRHDSFAAGDLCQLAGLTEPQLAELESFGLLAGKGSGDSTTYTAGDLAIAQAAAGFMQHGVGGRHLKAWRQAAEREASLFEQMILPLLRQRNPQARQQAVDTLTSLTELGGELRSAIVHSALSHHLDGVMARRVRPSKADRNTPAAKRYAPNCDRDGVGRGAGRGSRQHASRDLA